jgi:hypothetical protein
MTTFSRLRKARRRAVGVVYVETLVALPVVIYFAMTTVQLVDYMLSSFLVKHAAIAAARAGAVIGSDNPKLYGGQALNDLNGGQRLTESRKAVAQALQAKEQFKDGGFTLSFDASRTAHEMITARLSVNYKCLLSSLNAICGFQDFRTMTATGTFPYQAANTSWE